MAPSVTRTATSQNYSPSPQSGMKDARNPSPSKQRPTIQIDPSALAALAARGSSPRTDSTWRNQSPLLFSPAALLSLAGCGNQTCPGDDCSVLEANQPPEFTWAQSNYEGQVNEKLEFWIRFLKPEEGETLELRMEPNGSDYPNSARLVRGDTKTAYKFEWTPREGQEGWYGVQLILSDGELEVERDVTIHVKGLEDADTDGGTGGLEEEWCEPTGKGIGDGTPESPYQFSILVYVGKQTQGLAFDRGWDLEAAIANQITSLNTCFNNGQLYDNYKFQLMGIQYHDEYWDVDTTPKPTDTPEDEDFLFVYDARKLLTAAGQRTVKIGHEKALDPSDDFSKTICHEVGHLRGAKHAYYDYNGEDNKIYPGAGYDWPGASIMGRPQPPPGEEWDPLNIELIKETAADPYSSGGCAYNWIPTWAPENIQVNVTNGEGLPVTGAEVDIYRKNVHEIFTDSTLWHSGLTNSEGNLPLPPGLTVPPSEGNPYYTLFLGAIHVAGETYLNWYTVEDIAIPFRQGATQLTLAAKTSKETLYVAPTPIHADLSIQSVTISPNTLKGGETLQKTIQIANGGPDIYSGKLGIQYFLSTDPALDKNEDVPIGGKSEIIELNPGEFFQHISSYRPLGLTPPGFYYVIATINPDIPLFTDPDVEDYVLNASSQVTILPPD